MEKRAVRPRPCPSCPYRTDVPSGIWDAAEYDRLPLYDQDTPGQIETELFSLFLCHSGDGWVCAGWAGCHDMTENLAARLGVSRGFVGPEIFDYESPVELFGSGAEAAGHGKREIPEPGEDARRHIGSLYRQIRRRE